MKYETTLIWAIGLTFWIAIGAAVLRSVGGILELALKSIGG